PTGADLDLVRAFGPGDVIAELIVIRLVVPRPATDVVVRPRGPREIDGGDAVEVVTLEQLSNRETARPGVDAIRDQAKLIAIGVEGDFVQQRRVDRVCGMDHAVIGRIAEDRPYGRYVIAGPL